MSVTLTGREVLQVTGVSAAGVPAGVTEQCSTQDIANLGGGGGGTPGGSTTQIQYNNAGAFGGISGVTSNGTTITIASGDLKLSGATSGTVTLNAPGTGGGTVTLPSGSVTLAPTVSPAFTTPSIDVATGTSLALGGATIGSDVLGLTGSATFNTGPITFASAPLVISGNLSAASWGGAAIANMTGLRIKGISGTMTDTSTAASGTVVQGATDLLGGNTIAATNASVVYTNYYSMYFKAPVAGTNITLTNAFALGADSLKINGVAVLGGSLTFATDNTYSIGANGANRPLNIYLSNLLKADGNIQTGGSFIGDKFISSSDSVALFTRTNSSVLQFGAANAASPVAYTLTFQGPRGGSDTNVAGTNATVIGSIATGSASSGDIIFQTGGAVGGSGTTAATPTTALTIKGVTQLVYTNSATQILGSKTTITGGATGNTPTLTAGPVTGNPTKWLPYDDNGTTRYVPSW
jgi:hypothetical protein